MSYVLLDKPEQGEATKKPLADGLIDNDAFFNSVLSSLNWMQIPNGSFEIDTDADGEPDLWTPTLYTLGDMELTGHGLTDTDCRHGQRAIKFTSPGGSGNGGGYVESDEFNECAPERPVLVAWLHKSTVATIRNKVEILWFTAARTSISTSVIYTSITNPTSWTLQTGAATPPATARFFRLRFTGAEDTTTVAGSAYFDGVMLRSPDRLSVEVFTASGTWTVLAPRARIRAWGGGGAGDNSGSGGGGEYAEEIVDVVPGATYAVTIGAGGTTAGDGGDTTVGSLITANGGIGSTGGGSGGSGSSATLAISGQYGGQAGEFGGDAGGGGGSGGRGTAGGGGATGVNGIEPGGGGGSNTTGGDGNGAKGRVIIEYLY